MASMWDMKGQERPRGLSQLPRADPGHCHCFHSPQVAAPFPLAVKVLGNCWLQSTVQTWRQVGGAATQHGG